MRTQRSKESLLILDNRAGPGLDLPGGVGHGLAELPTFTCTHCQTIVILRMDRTRERAFCRKCDHYICDECGVIQAASTIHRPFAQVLDEAQELGARGLTVPEFTRNPNG